MNTLLSSRVTKTLMQLHRDAEVADGPFFQCMMARLDIKGETLEQEASRIIADERIDYRTLYNRHADHFLSVSPNYGWFIYSIARACKATRIVEFGTSMGISAIYLASALRDNGGGGGGARRFGTGTFQGSSGARSS